MESIKLVIWDLDETFWKGTLSEEGVEPIQERIEFVEWLVRHGVMCSISSKNDNAQAEKKLRDLGVLDYFVFPKINWNPKGEQIRETINDMGLRDVNVLFLDDNHGNIEEVKFYCPGIQTYHIVDGCLDLSLFEFNTKKDEGLSRLEQYRVLEKRVKASNHDVSNLDFLHSSNIVVKMEHANDTQHLERIHELIMRTNQLNFTKNRESIEKLQSRICSEDFINYLIHVRDNFGDYGSVGFISIKRKENVAEHFLFSCRIINLGVENFLWKHLEFPSVAKKGSVVSNLSQSFEVDWITMDSNKHTTLNESISKNSKKLFFKGGCDLEQMLFYLESADFTIEKEMNYVSSNNLTIHNEHTQILLDALDLSNEDEALLIEDDNLPMVDQRFYKTKFWSKKNDVIVYSLLMDYTNDIYISSSGHIIPMGGYYDSWNDQRTFQKLIDKGVELNKEGFESFGKRYKNIGPITLDKFEDNLRNLCQSIPHNNKLILINGAEVRSSMNVREKDAHIRHKNYNLIVDKVVSENANVYLLDVRKHVLTENDIGDNIRHYSRVVYKNLADNLLELLQNIDSDYTFSVKNVGWYSRLYFKFKARIPKKVKIKLRKYYDPFL